MRAVHRKQDVLSEQVGVQQHARLVRRHVLEPHACASRISNGASPSNTASAARVCAARVS